MSFVDLILKKRNGMVLSDSEIHEFVDGVKNRSMESYQISAMLMAIYFQGMNAGEIAALTREMAFSGDILEFPTIHEPIVDKHSSGGVGDKTSLVLAPVVAACGLPIAKLSGRGLGFTGGTIDKLESIPGFRTELSEEEFIHAVEKDGIALIGQSKEIAPVDKVLYALRDVTGTVDSIPLIAASIMSKKLADGSDAIVLDVKVGSGAFMKTKEQAIELARVMVGIGEDNGKSTIALVTSMDQPLGSAVGNALEVKEALAALRGEGPVDFVTECRELAAAMLIAGKKAELSKEAFAMVDEVIAGGKAMEKMKAMVRNQGGDVAYIEDPELFPDTRFHLNAGSPRNGYVSAINAEEIGKSSLLLGAGRQRTSDTIDPAVGLCIHKKVGDSVQEGDCLFTVFANDDKLGKQALSMALSAYSFSDRPVSPLRNPVIAIVDKSGVRMQEDHE